MIEFNWSDAADWLFRWQTLVGAAIAIPFAGAAILVPVLQERSRVSRRFQAVRATLPLYLSSVSQYAQEIGEALAACRSSGGVRASRVAAFIKPEIPADLVGALERAIEATGNRVVIRRLARMIAEMQVLDTRASAVPTEIPDGPYFDVMLLQAGTIYAQASSLFDFARGERNRADQLLAWSDVRSALRIMNVREGNYGPLFAMMSRFEERGADPEERTGESALRRKVRQLGRRITARIRKWMFW